MPRDKLDTDPFREKLIYLLRRAYAKLPELDAPDILDMGCGSGIPSIELARLSNGTVTGVDINQSELDKMRRNVERAGLSDRVKAVNCSFFDPDFPDESYDVVWSEGSIQFIGFEKGLRTWRRLLKPGGFLVIHATEQEVVLDKDTIATCGYSVYGQDIYPASIWWDEYYKPLEEYIEKLKIEYRDNPQDLPDMTQELREIKMVKNNPNMPDGILLVLQKC
jgi:ubiquinone/menaquinone biosynthesis C-methylase UbiE